jgi:hypothetical protein
MRLPVLIWMMLATALAGAGVMAIVAVPSLSDRGMELIPWAAAGGAVLAIPFAIVIARRIEAATRSAA